MCDEDSGTGGWRGVKCYIKSNEKFRLDSYSLGNLPEGAQIGPCGRQFKLVTATELDREASNEEKIIIACHDGGLPLSLTGIRQLILMQLLEFI